MSLDKVNRWLTLLANVGVLAGIVFLALEMRHSSNAINAQTYDSIANGFITLNMATITDATVGIIWVTGLSDPASISESEAINGARLPCTWPNANLSNERSRRLIMSQPQLIMVIPIKLIQGLRV